MNNAAILKRFFLVLVLGVPGLFADNAKTLATATKHILEDGKQNKYDANALPLPWNEQVQD